MSNPETTRFTAADLRADGDPGDIVGHGTKADGSHVPLTREAAAAILEAAEERQVKREADMPTERAAIDAMFEAWQRLKELGWREAQYCPKDGSSFDVIEAGSTGIHPCFYEGEWPDGYFMVGEGEWCGPSRPILFKLRPEDQAKHDAKLAALRARFRAEREAEINAG